MRQRKEHVITKIHGDAQPTRLVALSVDAECVGVPDALCWQRERFASWSSVGWARTVDGVYREWECQHADIERLWRAIIWGAKRPGVTWLVAHRMVRVASLLNLWGLIDGGQLEWDGSGQDRSRDAAGAGDVRSLCHDTPDGGKGRDGKNRPPVPILPPVYGSAGSRGGASELLPRVAPSSAALDDPPTVLRLRVPGLPGRLLFLDSRNWGIEPQRDFPSASAEARWLAGVMRRMVDELVQRGWGGLAATAGSQSLKTWRRAFLTHDVVAHANDDILELERRAYVGGRCECLRLGEVQGPLYMVDRRSAYAAACADLDIPCRVKGFYHGGLEGLRRDPERCGSLLSEARVEGSEPAYPSAGRDGVRYPVGRRSVVLAGPEFRDAVERGAVVGLGRVVEYECAPALRQYAGALWRARTDFAAAAAERAAPLPGPDAAGRIQHADGQGQALEGWVKKLLVGLPGKLGQRVADWVPEPALCPPAPWFSWWGISREREIYRLRSLGGAVQRQERGGWTYDAVPAAACWVMSHARLKLLQTIRVVGWEHALYMDTDSLLVDQAGYDALCAAPGLIGDGLGQWRVVRTVSRAVIHGQKYYEHDGEVTCAGMPKADTAPTRLLDRYWYRQTFGIALGEGHAPVAARRLRPFCRAPQYKLGRVGDNGRVYPHVAEDW